MGSVWSRILMGLAALFVSMNGIGYLFGSYNSPRYDTRTSAIQFLISNAEYHYVDDILESISITAGPSSYVYSVQNAVLHTSLISMDEIMQLQIPKRNRLTEIEQAAAWIGVSASVPGGAVGALKYLRGSSQSENWLLRNLKRSGIRATSLLAFSFSAGYIGYRIGYDDSADYDNEKFQEVLGDQDLYEDLFKNVIKCDAANELFANPIDGSIYTKFSIQGCAKLYTFIKSDSEQNALDNLLNWLSN